MIVFFNKTSRQSWSKNEIKTKNQHFLNQIFKKSKKNFAYNEIFLEKFTKKSLGIQWDLSLAILSHREGLKMQKTS